MGVIFPFKGGVVGRFYFALLELRSLLRTPGWLWPLSQSVSHAGWGGIDVMDLFQKAQPRRFDFE